MGFDCPRKLHEGLEGRNSKLLPSEIEYALCPLHPVEVNFGRALLPEFMGFARGGDVDGDRHLSDDLLFDVDRNFPHDRLDLDLVDLERQLDHMHPLFAFCRISGLQPRYEIFLLGNSVFQLDDALLQHVDFEGSYFLVFGEFLSELLVLFLQLRKRCEWCMLGEVHVHDDRASTLLELQMLVRKTLLCLLLLLRLHHQRIDFGLQFAGVSYRVGLVDFLLGGCGLLGGGGRRRLGGAGWIRIRHD